MQEAPIALQYNGDTSISDVWVRNNNVAGNHFHNVAGYQVSLEIANSTVH